MTANKKIRDEAAPSIAHDSVIKDLAKIAFASMADFARFNADGSAEIFDYDKAREIGAKVSVVTRTVGRGKHARQVRTTSIRMPNNKLSALIRLGKHLGLFTARRGPK